MYCETNYKKLGHINRDDLEEKRIQELMSYHYDQNIGLINYLLRYPIGNILSDYLMNHSFMKSEHDICQICLNTNLYDILEKNHVVK